MEWLFLLLPIAALSGWLSARSHYKKRYQQSQQAFNPDYFKGLNYLLNEQPDKAIDVFIGLLEVNSETVETHFALANLFRRRGETERAIRLHQNLIARPTLTSVQRDHALIELGLDYMSAGVLDRAEQLFTELLSSPQPPIATYRHLLNLYQLQKQWKKAIDMAKKLQNHDTKIGAEIAQMYCELAEESLTQQDFSTSLALLKQAVQYDKSCVRASLLEADVHIQSKHYQKALKSLDRVESQDPSLLPEALPLLYTCHHALHQLASFKIWLEASINRHPTLFSVQLMLVRVIEMESGTEAAQAYLQQHLMQHPSIEGLDHLLSLGQMDAESLSALVSNMTQHMIQQGRHYVCKHCGFAGKTMHWHCPSCQHWGSIRLNNLHFSSFEPVLEH